MAVTATSLRLSGLKTLGDLGVLTTIPSLKHLTFHEVPRAEVDRIARTFRGLTLSRAGKYLVGDPRRLVSARTGLPEPGRDTRSTHSRCRGLTA